MSLINLSSLSISSPSTCTPILNPFPPIQEPKVTPPSSCIRPTPHPRLLIQLPPISLNFSANYSLFLMSQMSSSSFSLLPLRYEHGVRPLLPRAWRSPWPCLLLQPWPILLGEQLTLRVSTSSASIPPTVFGCCPHCFIRNAAIEFTNKLHILKIFYHLPELHCCIWQ